MSSSIADATAAAFAPAQDEYNVSLAQPETVSCPQFVKNKMRNESYQVEGAVETRENEVWPSGGSEPTDEERRTNRVGKTVEISINHLDATYLQMCQLYCIYMPLQLRIDDFKTRIIDRLPEIPQGYSITSSTGRSLNLGGYEHFCNFDFAFRYGDYKTTAQRIPGTEVGLGGFALSRAKLAELDHPKPGEAYESGQWEDDDCLCLMVDRDMARRLRVGLSLVIAPQITGAVGTINSNGIGTRIRGIYLDAAAAQAQIQGDMITGTVTSGTPPVTTRTTETAVFQIPKAILILSTKVTATNLPKNFHDGGQQPYVYAPVEFLKCEDLFGPSFMRDISELDPTQAEFDYRYHYSPRMQYRDVVFREYYTAGNSLERKDSNNNALTIFPDFTKQTHMYVDIINKNRLSDEAENHMVKDDTPYESNDEMKEGCLHFGLKFPDVGQYVSDVARGIKNDTEPNLEKTGGGLVMRIFLPGIRYRRDHTTHLSKLDFRYAQNTVMALRPSLADDKMEKTMINDLEYATIYPKDTLYYAASQRKLGLQKNKHTDWPLSRSVVEESRNMSNYGLNHVRWQIPFPWQQMDSTKEEPIPLRSNTQPLSIKLTFLNSHRLVEDRDDNGNSYAHRLGVRRVRDGETQYTQTVYNVAESANQLREWINYQCPAIEPDLMVDYQGQTVRHIMRWGDEATGDEGYSQISGTASLSDQVPLAYNILSVIRDISLSDTSESRVAVRADIRDVHFETTKTITQNEIERAAIQSHISGRLYTIPRYLFEKFEVINEIKGEHKFKLSVPQTDIVKAFHIAVRRKKPTSWSQRAQVDELTRNVAQERIPYMSNFYNRYDTFLDSIEYFDFRSGDTSLLDRENRKNRNVKYHMHDRMRRKLGRTTLFQCKGNIRNIISWMLSDPLFGHYNQDKSSVDFNRIYDPTIVVVFKEGVQQAGLEVCIAYHCVNALLYYQSNFETVRAQTQ